MTFNRSPGVELFFGQLSPRPVLLIYATDGRAGEHINPAYVAAARENASIWEISEG